jgi:hypothetical protein
MMSGIMIKWEGFVASLWGYPLCDDKEYLSRADLEDDHITLRD